MSELSLDIKHLNKRFEVEGKSIEILRDINLEVKKASLLQLWGIAAAVNQRC